MKTLKNRRFLRHGAPHKFCADLIPRFCWPFEPPRPTTKLPTHGIMPQPGWPLWRIVVEF
jgi:hypothetical protein